MLAASAAFQVVGANIAADVVGAMLVRWHYIALAAPLLLFAIELRRVRRFILFVLFAALMLAAAQGMVDLRLRALRNAGVNISALDPDDPIRRGFGRLHGISMTMLLAQTLCAAIVVATDRRSPETDGRLLETDGRSPETDGRSQMADGS